MSYRGMSYGASNIPMEIDPTGIGLQQASQLQNFQTNQQQYQMNQSLLPEIVAAKKAELDAQTQAAPLEVQEKQQTLNEGKQRSQLADIQVQNETLANVARQASAADPGDAPQIWDEGMKEAAANGVGAASQYVGHYRPDLAERVSDVYSGNGKSQSASNMDPEMVQRAVAQMQPTQLKTVIGNMNRAIESFNNVKDEQSWNSELQVLKQAGVDVSSFLPNTEWSPLNYASASRAVQNLIPYRDAAVQRASIMGFGGAPIPAKPFATPDYKMAGVDQDAKPIFYDAHNPNSQITGDVALGARPSAQIGAFQFKVQAALNSGMNQQDALQFANGKKAVAPEQMREMALAEANKEYGDLSLSGAADAITNPQAWISAKAAQNFQMISGSGQAPAGAGAGRTGPNGSRPAALPARAIQALAGAKGQPVRFANGTVWRMGPNNQPQQIR